MEVLLINRPTHVCKTRALLALILLMWVPMEVMAGTENATHLSTRPSSLNIGALFTLNSVIGRAAKPAIYAAIDDVNSDPSILPGTKLNVILYDQIAVNFLELLKVFPETPF
ncbi:glutamate receptor 3.4 [Prunus yedoensis var. nudiflora]|uniref:Glutamate receptor 3.4 n=1 Tax=Prunus yedoensis var. nudiflora TaxID=2094558 RepID=A0A314XKG1_PRUYE|nr:glutamate receptor 3.4 [Prunus yedoensis var. nudiflora]